MKKFYTAFKYIQLIASLRFMPDKIQKWLSGTGIKTLEIASAFIMLGFASVLITGGHEIFIADPYPKPERLHPHTMAVIMFIVAIVQLTTAYHQTARSNVLSGFTLLVSALIWFIVFGLCTAACPPLSPDLFTLVLSIVCALAGRALVVRNRNREDERH